MAINLYGPPAAGPTSQIDGTGLDKAAISQNKSAAPSTVPQEDTTAFSSTATAVDTLTQAALQTVPTRQQKVESLKDAVNGAQYQLDAAKIAASLASSDL